MASTNQRAGGKKTNSKTPEKTKGPLSNQEKKETMQAALTKEIKNLQDDNKRLSLENVTLKNNFDLREIIKVLSPKGVTEMDPIEIAKDSIKMALKEAEEKHSAEIKEMEKKHKKEIEKLSQNLQGEDQLPFNLNPEDVTDGKSEDYLKRLLVEKQQLIKALDDEKMKHANYITEMESGDNKHSQETIKEIAKFRAQNKELEREVGSLKAEKDELNKNIKILKTETETLKKKLEETEVLLSQKESELTRMEENVTHFQTSEKSKGKHLKQDKTKNDVNHNHKGENNALADTKEITVAMQNLELPITELKQLKEETKNLNYKLKEAEELLRQKETEITDMKKELANLKQRSQETISKPVNPDDIHILVREPTKEKDEAKSEKNALLAEKQKLEGEIKKLQNDNKEQKRAYEKSKELTENEKGALLAEKQKMDAEIKTLQYQNKALKQFEENNKNLSEKLKKLEQEKDNLNKKVSALQKENDEVKYRLKESQSPSLSNVISANDNKAVQQLKDENERLPTRLREVAGAKLKDELTPQIDLSDPNRPTKLGEKYSELYDYQWTDAFANLSKKYPSASDERLSAYLYDILTDGYRFCQDVRQAQNRSFEEIILCPAGGEEYSQRRRNEEIPEIFYKYLSEAAKVSSNVTRVNVVKAFVTKETTKKKYGEIMKLCESYIEECIQLCWQMQIHIPPVCIDLKTVKMDSFVADIYKEYTRRGEKIAFVVWPALFLHENGPLLVKGVAQGE